MTAMTLSDISIIMVSVEGAGELSKLLPSVIAHALQEYNRYVHYTLVEILGFLEEPHMQDG
eukprot:1157918-Pelagomonas_calceolata.AAC.3